MTSKKGSGSTMPAFYAGIHRMVFGYHRMLSKRFPFGIYYRMVDEVVLVTAVPDCRRNPGWTRQRMFEG